MKYNYIYLKQILELILDNNYYDIADFKYDYESKNILYKNEEFEPKLESIKFKIAFDYNFHWKEFQDTIYYFARMNTPKPEKELDILYEPIYNWLKSEEKKETTILEIITNVFGGKIKNLTNRQLQMRIANCLKELGWKKIRHSTHNSWITE